MALLPYTSKITVSGNVGDISLYTSPLKIFDFMKAGKLILCSDLKVIREILVNNHNSLLIKNFKNKKIWLNKIRLISSNFKKYDKIRFNAFNYAQASHGGIFMNGSFPALTIIIGVYFFKEFPVKLQLFGIVLIMFGAILSMIDGSIIYTKESWIGDLLFFVAAIFFAFYLTLCRLWNVSLLQVVMCSSIFNGAIYIPIWFFFFNSVSFDQDLNGLYLQLVYQGLVPNLLGLLLLAISVRYIGPNPTAAILAGVPSMGIFLGFFLLGENIGFLGILGLITITPGILIVALTKSKIAES